jgi:hypothetical protein
VHPLLLQNPLVISSKAFIGDGTVMQKKVANVWTSLITKDNQDDI